MKPLSQIVAEIEARCKSERAYCRPGSDNNMSLDLIRSECERLCAAYRAAERMRNDIFRGEASAWDSAEAFDRACEGDE